VTLAEVTRAAVLRAIRECRRLGRAVFLAKYGYRTSCYRLRYKGCEYDSKAILGVAFGYAFNCAPLDPKEFSGGVEHCARVLLRLGFTLHRDGVTLSRQLVDAARRLVRRVRKVVAGLVADARSLIVGLVSCSKEKLKGPAYARELYSPSWVFERCRRYVEARCAEWLILSAKYGLVEPTAVIEYYDKTLSKMPKRERDAWARDVQAALRKRYAGVRVQFILMAGKLYATAVETLDAEVIEPLKGLGTGYPRHRRC
jgi:ribosomal protein S27AE